MSERKAYPSDLSDAHWALIEPTLTAWRQARLDRRPTGQPATVELREVFNAILYVERTGIAWKYLPHDSPTHTTRSTPTNMPVTSRPSASAWKSSPETPGNADSMS